MTNSIKATNLETLMQAMDVNIQYTLWIMIDMVNGDMGSVMCQLKPTKLYLRLIKASPVLQTWL